MYKVNATTSCLISRAYEYIRLIVNIANRQAGDFLTGGSKIKGV